MSGEGAGDHDDLVPIRLRMSLGEHHIVDTLLWNRKDGPAQMQRFSEGFCKDTGIPVSLAPALVKEIQRQVEAWGARAQPIRIDTTTERLEVIRCGHQAPGPGPKRECQLGCMFACFGSRAGPEDGSLAPCYPRKAARKVQAVLPPGLPPPTPEGTPRYGRVAG
jgi:hypothetical protein